MSLLLDAIKQSGQHEQTAVDHDQAALALKQQQELTRYRRLAFSFGLLLAAILTLMAGFSIGKWLQQNKPFAEQPKVVNNSHEATESAATEAQASPESQQPAKQDQVAQPHTQQAANNPAQVTTMPQQGQLMQLAMGQQQMMQQVPVQGQQYQWVQVPVNSAPVYANQGYQVQPQYQQQAVYQNQPVYQSQPQFSQPMQMQQINPQQMSSNGIDLSKYKVLGKPLDGQPTQPASQSSTNDELRDVPDTLKDAFAKAVEDVDNAHSVDITRSTKNTSYAEPIELLPDALQSLIPTIKYQAHIYASESSKRWIKLNGRELYEGDNIGVLSVVEITPEQSLLSYDGYEFTLKALQDWPE
ncbi:general secretion pathway protein GspB [Pseudoalteromonas haloplanktis]|nr:general secretion pathway protein GspB [Pseudoalteromonas haloplanktis]